jgi:hypothetical protein
MVTVAETLLEETQRLLEDRLLTHSLMHVALTAQVNYFWLRKFSKQEIKNPGVRTVERLKRYLVDA